MKASVSDMGLRKDFKDVCVVNDACEIEYIHVLCRIIGIVAPGDGNQTALDVPAQDYLRDAFSVFSGNGADCPVLKNRTSLS